MRILLLMLFSLSFASLKAQNTYPVSVMDYNQLSSFAHYNGLEDSTTAHKKWFLTRYAGLSTGIGFYSGGSATFVSAPIGLQLNRQLNNNLYAFARLSAAPSFVTFNQSFQNPAFSKNSPLYGGLSNPYGFGVVGRAEMGLMYVNDAKTFTISGSIGVQRGTYPVYPAYRPRRQPAAGSLQ